VDESCRAVRWKTECRLYGDLRRPHPFPLPFPFRSLFCSLFIRMTLLTRTHTGASLTKRARPGSGRLIPQGNGWVMESAPGSPVPYSGAGSPYSGTPVSGSFPLPQSPYSPAGAYHQRVGKKMTWLTHLRRRLPRPTRRRRIRLAAWHAWVRAAADERAVD
jgi:hypothetical protein